MPSSPIAPMSRFSKTKIVATVGPSCDGVDRLAGLLEEGVDVFRLNTAHGTREDLSQRLAEIRQAVRQTGHMAAVLVDLAGPKIRLEALPGDQLVLTADARVRFVRSPGASLTVGSPADTPAQVVTLTTTYAPLVDEVDPGDRIMLADGLVGLVVESKGSDYAACRVVQGGTVRSRQGVNLPGARLSVGALTETDRQNALWAAENDIDFIGLSFVRRAEDVLLLKSLLAGHGSKAQVVAKIEKPEALNALDAVVSAADAVMVARGDLGVETDIAQVALVQKQIIEVCHRHRKPVIVATQMLDSMHNSALPTRAEVTDVANAILDGADACMLSGETAVGQYSRQAVAMMHRIALATEPTAPPDECGLHEPVAASNEIREAVVEAASLMAQRLEAKMVVVATKSGATALALSKYRNPVPTVGTSADAATLRRMCLYWGVFPLAQAPTANAEPLAAFVTDAGRRQGYLASGDRILIVSGTGVASGSHNAIAVHEVT